MRCAVCGVEIVRRKDGALFHADDIPKHIGYHLPQPVDEADAPPTEADEPMPVERLANAAERIAAALERLVESQRRA